MPRTSTQVLSPEQIEELLDFVKPNPDIPPETALSIVELHKTNLRKQLEGQKIYPAIIPTLKQCLERYYYTTLIQAGESVGIICAQSIGEKNTQTTLNTFHKAGQSEKTMTAGVPRFQELLNATKKPRIVNHQIYFLQGNKTIEDIRETVGHTIVGLTFKELAINTEVILDKKPEPWYEAYKLLYGDSWVSYKHCISFKINKAKLFEFKLTLANIADYIHSQYDDLYCVFSPPQFCQFDVWVDTDNIELPLDRILYIDSNNAIEIYLEECVQPALEELNLCGIQGINEVFYTQADNKEWFVETNGINSRSITTQYINYKTLLALKNVDYTRTISNNVWDIYEVLGIEAARTFLIQEFMGIMDGINTCHASLLVDRMTHGGSISSITRYTMKKDESGPFGKASFEETMDNFLNAATRGETEPTEGVSASIICGKKAPVGTGIMDLTVDLTALPLEEEDDDDY